jgi:2-phosphoglycerate kinase
MSQIVIISGPSGAGKSATAESLCERYDRTVHIETDDFFGWIRMGYLRPWIAGSDRQNQMVTRAVARAATAYAHELYAVFIDGVIGPHLLPLYVEELKAAGVPIHFLVLMPRLEQTFARVDGREARLNMPEEAHRGLYEQFAGYGAFAGMMIDNSDLTADQTADRVMDACGRGQCLVWSPD